MQPQSPSPNLPSPNPDYNFIFDSQQKKRSWFKLPGGNNLGKLTLLIIGVGAVVGIGIVVLSSILGPKINTKEVVDVIARGEEIVRVSNNVAQKSRDLNTANLASTTSTAVTSQDGQLISYLAKNKKKVSPKEIAIYTNTATDTAVVSADQNNNLSEYYDSYLKKSLTTYQSSIKTAFDTSNGPNLRAILQNFSNSNQILLSTQQLANATPQ
jgi:hypothetical protein